MHEMNVSKAEAVCKCGNLALAAKKSFEKIDALITKQQTLFQSGYFLQQSCIMLPHLLSI